MGLIDSARERLAAARDAIKMPKLPSWWKRRDATAERRAIAAQIHPMLIAGCFVAAFAAAAVEVGFMFLRVVRMVGDVHWLFDWTGGNGEAVVPGFVWEFHLTLHPLLAALLFAASCVVVWFSLFWIPGQLALRGQGPFRRATMVAVGLICNLYIFSNVVVGQHDNRVEDMRTTAVVQQQVALSRSTIERNIERIDEQLTAMRDQARVGTYAAIAASVGAEAYRRDYMGAAAMANEPSEARRQIIRRAVGAAARADALEEERRGLEGRLAEAPTEASVATSIATDRASRDVEGFKNFVDAWQGVVLGVALSLVGILGSYWGFGLLQARALLDPTAPEKEHAEARAEAKEDAAAPVPSETIEKRDIAPAADELVLPPLPDLRGLPDPVFDALGATVDEEGRVMRRFSGWRGAPKANNDKRRAPEPPDETIAETPIPAANDDDDLSDIASWVRGQAKEEFAK